ncbi:radical SAM enzyme, rSAM/lipoprotein system [Bacteroidales bacterium WCE2004]|nr:radical SAM enzyme, rSAM/lipoprotein system [Bacteroidales bacterium WCE2004]
MQKNYRLDLRHRLALGIDRALQRDVRREHPLEQLFWECTLRCNLACRHCGSDCKIASGTPDMPVEDFLRVLDSINRRCAPHSVFVVVTGGEPLMRPDLEACGRAIHDRGFAWGMVTNGFALTEERLDRLVASGLGSATVSLDGLQEAHDWMRGRSGSFERASAAIRLLAARPDIVFDVVTCVNRRNYPELPRLKEALVSWGVRSWRLFTVVPMGRAAGDPELQLPPDQFRGLLDFIKATRKEGRIHASYGCEGFLGNYEGEVRDHFFHCEAGVTAASILADGSISACASIRSDYHQGNIYRGDDLMEVWEHGFLPYRDREWMRTDECAECRYFRYCQGGGMHLRDRDGKLLFCHLKRIA